MAIRFASWGRCSIVVIVTNSWPAYQEFEPGTTKDPPCRRGRCTLNMSRLKRPPVGVVWKIRGLCQLQCRPRHLTRDHNYTRSVSKSPRISE
ncbi:hypothetical protein TNCV_758471 [Trichonephila clavipes]|nr:hypothetical protein TNCV_758471 [Trichonephila clavipes]